MQNSKTPNLDRVLGLHQTLEVIYVVDGYQARVVHESEEVLYESKVKPTIDEAIANCELKAALEGRG